MEWLGHAKIEFTHAANPRVILNKDGSETDLLKIIEKSTPPCHLNPLLFNGHVQTMWTATKPEGPKIWYRRRMFEAELEAYKGTFAVDFAVEPFEGSEEGLPRRTTSYTDEEFKNIASDDNKPMLVVLHGLSGGSHEVYLRHAMAPLLGEGGWEACVVNSRGCARTKLTSGMLYNARATWDIRQTVKWLRKTFPNRPLFGIGFSLGANILTNYCGEEGEDCEFKAAIAVASPFNLEVASKMHHSSYIGMELYQRVMGSAMKAMINSHRKELEQYTDLDLEAIDKITYLREFDELVQCKLFGYPTAWSYYRDSTSTDAILNIKIPFLAISSTDDPIAVKEALPYAEIKANPNTVLLTTSLGGHLCWFEMGGSRWHTKPICNFLNAIAFEADTKAIKPLSKSNGTKPIGGLNYAPMRRKLQYPGSD